MLLKSILGRINHRMAILSISSVVAMGYSQLDMGIIYFIDCSGKICVE